MRFFHYSLPVDPSRIQFNFETTLRRHNISAPPNALDALFSKLKLMGSSDGANLDSPFPLVRSEAAAHNHAKKMQAALGGKDGPKLGKCQQILSEFYGFGKWDFFKTAIMEFSKIKMAAETQTASGMLQSILAAGLPQKTAMSKSGLTTADVEKNDILVTKKASETVVEAMPDRQLGFEETAMILAEEQADRLLAMEEAALITAEEEADRQFAFEEAAMILAEEQAGRLLAMEEAALIAAEDEADRSVAEEEDDNEDFEEDVLFDGHRDWVDDLDPDMQDFADQFGSKEEFDEYMESI